MAKYQDSPFGVTRHNHLNVPDTKYNADGLFHSELILEGAEGEAFANKVEAASKAALDAYLNEGDGKDLTPAMKNKWQVYVPFTREETDEGELTGRIIFDFKQNATIKVKDKAPKKVTIGLYDAEGTEMSETIVGGSVCRFRYSMRPIPMKTDKRVGVRLDFAMVQVKELGGSGSGGAGGGFGAVEGYTTSGGGKPYSKADEGGSSQSSNDADY